MIGYRTVVEEFRAGTRFYEYVNGISFEFTCSEDPIVEGDQVSWKARNYDGGLQEFLITKGFEHYGPKLYWNSGVYVK